MKKVHDGETMSLWLDEVELPQFSSLKENIAVDVCVVGAGIGGVTTAYLLQKEGKSVCILEDFEVGAGQTGRTTAHFSNALDDRYFNLEKYHGEKGARLAAESHTAAIDFVERTAEELNIDCDLERVDGYLFSPSADQDRIIDQEAEATLRVGLVGVDKVDANLIAPLKARTVLRFRDQMQLHPGKYLNGLVKAFVAGGGKIFTHSHARKIKGGSDAFVETSDGFKVTAQAVVVATNAPVNDQFVMHTKQSAYRTYAIAIEVPKDCLPRGLFWDTIDPYHYVRFEKENILIVGGEDHKTGQNDRPEECFDKLETWIRERIPAAGKVQYRWSGQVLEPVDGLGYMGRNPADDDNVYIITGDSGHGMTHCTIGGLLITDLIAGRENPWEELYKPSRVSLRASLEFAKENANVALQYADWIVPHSKDVEQIPNGSGVVVREGAKLIAVYKDDAGQVERMTAVCPHLGGIVRWNSAEKSWDCPCHGSRFDCHGSVIEGPSLTGLAAEGSQAPAKGKRTVEAAKQTHQ